MTTLELAINELAKVGASLVAFAPGVVLARRPNRAASGREYVTWAVGANGGLFWGHYDMNRTHGLLDFAERVKLDT